MLTAWKKKLCLFVLVSLLAMNVVADVPNGFSYQAIVRNLSGQVVSNQIISVQIEILFGSATGSIVYSEHHSVSSNLNGLISLTVGDGMVSQGDFSRIDWATGPYFIQTKIDPSGGFNYSIVTTSQLLSVPYAIQAGNAQHVSGTVSFSQLTDVPATLGFSGDYNDLINLPDVFDGDYNSLTNTPILAVVAQSGNYNDLQNKPVLFSGKYGDLTEKPILQTVASTGNYNDLTQRPVLSLVATSGDYNDLINRPVIGSSSFTGNYNDLLNRPNFQDSIRLYAFGGDYTHLSNVPNFSAVAFTGNYNDLTNKPTIQEGGFNGDYNALFNLPTLFSGNYEDLTNKPSLFSGRYVDLLGLPSWSDTIRARAFSGNYADLRNTPQLATVATTGSYNDLTDKPTVMGGMVADSIVPRGVTQGDLLYWNESAKHWNVCAAGLEGQVLTMKGGVPTWADPVLLFNTENYQVGDLFYKDGREEGVVAFVSEASRSAYLLLGQGVAYWDNDTVHSFYIGATDSVSGANNMIAVKQQPNFSSRFKAFGEAEELGGYIPSTLEMGELMKNINDINFSLIKSQKDTISSNLCFWTSVERDVQNAYAYVYNGMTIGVNDTLWAEDDYLLLDTIPGVVHKDSLIAKGFQVPRGGLVYTSKTRCLPFLMIRSLSWSEVTSKPKKQYQVGDVYYNEDTKSPLGVVFEVDESGYHGKMMGLSQDSLSWSTIDTLTNANNYDRGVVNLDALMQLQIDSFGVVFPIVNWLPNQSDEGWSFPAQNEMQTIVRQSATLNYCLKKLGAAIVVSGGTYWTSTETSKSSAYAVRSGASLITTELNKMEKHKVVAIREF